MTDDTVDTLSLEMIDKMVRMAKKLKPWPKKERQMFLPAASVAAMSAFQNETSKQLQHNTFLSQLTDRLAKTRADIKEEAERNKQESPVGDSLRQDLKDNMGGMRIPGVTMPDDQREITAHGCDIIERKHRNATPDAYRKAPGPIVQKAKELADHRVATEALSKMIQDKMDTAFVDQLMGDGSDDTRDQPPHPVLGEFLEKHRNSLKSQQEVINKAYLGDPVSNHLIKEGLIGGPGSIAGRVFKGDLDQLLSEPMSGGGGGRRSPLPLSVIEKIKTQSSAADTILKIIERGGRKNE